MPGGSRSDWRSRPPPTPRSNPVSSSLTPPWIGQRPRHERCPDAPRRRPLLFVLLAEILELGIDHVALLAALTAVTGAGAAGRLGLGLRVAVHRLGELVRGGLQVLLGALDPLEVLAVQRLARLVERGLDRALVLRGDLVAVIPERALGGVHERVGTVLGFDLLAVPGVLGRVRL